MGIDPSSVKKNSFLIVVPSLVVIAHYLIVVPSLVKKNSFLITIVADPCIGEGGWRSQPPLQGESVAITLQDKFSTLASTLGRISYRPAYVRALLAMFCHKRQ